MTVPAARIVFDADDRAAVAAAVAESLATGALTLGPHTERFETAFAAAHRAQHAVAVSTGTAALEIALRVVGVANHDVVLPSNTFYATAAAVVHAGGRPVFADVAASTFALTAETIEAVLTPSTKAVVLVHIGGMITPEVDAIRALCDRRGVALVEDAAHAHGCSLDGRMAGTFGLAGAFSFYPTKVITSGEGGMILTADTAAPRRGRASTGTRARARSPRTTTSATARPGGCASCTRRPALVHVQPPAGVREAPPHASPRATPRRWPVSTALTPLTEPRGCVSNFYKYILLLPAGRRPRALQGRGRRPASPCGSPARSTTCRCTSSRC